MCSHIQKHIESLSLLEISNVAVRRSGPFFLYLLKIYFFILKLTFGGTGICEE